MSIPSSDAPDWDADLPLEITHFFSLSYSNYLVLNRTLLEAMPTAWQQRFTAMLLEFEEAWRHEETADGFKVEAGEWVNVEELSDKQRALVGVNTSVDVWLEDNPEPDPNDTDRYDRWEAGVDQQWDSVEYFDRDGRTIDGYVFLPSPDPIEHYRRPNKHYTPGKF